MKANCFSGNFFVCLFFVFVLFCFIKIFSKLSSDQNQHYHETFLEQQIMNQYHGYWWPAALAPGHQQPQCWPTSYYSLCGGICPQQFLVIHVIEKWNFHCIWIANGKLILKWATGTTLFSNFMVGWNTDNSENYICSLWPSDAIWWHKSGSTLAQEITQPWINRISLKIIISISYKFSRGQWAKTYWVIDKEGLLWIYDFQFCLNFIMHSLNFTQMCF